MTEQEFVIHCLNDICAKNGFDDSTAMVQRDFELISREIDENTGIQISVSTIKRLMNGGFSRTPQIATLNAISQYLGFKNWGAYKNSITNNNKQKIISKNHGDISANQKNNRNIFLLNWKSIGAASIAVIFIIIFSISQSSSKINSNYDKAIFSANKTSENSIPNTVVFNYNIDSVAADSFFIQQSWDERRRKRIFKNSHTLTDIYYVPGYHVAKLIANESVIKTADVSIPTDKWFFFATDKSFGGMPEYIKTDNFTKNGSLLLSKKDLDINGIKTDEEKAFTYCYFPKKFEVGSDNFTFKARVRMNEVRNDQCSYIMCEVYCQRYFMYFKSMQKGCASEANAQFGDNELNGKKADLSSLCYDINQWMDVEMTVRNKQVSIYFNSKLVFTSGFKGSAKLITGLGFISDGLCEIDFVELKGLDGKSVYENNFDNANSMPDMH